MLTPYASLPISVALVCVYLVPSLPVRRVLISHLFWVAESSAVPVKSGAAVRVMELGETG